MGRGSTKSVRWAKTTILYPTHLKSIRPYFTNSSRSRCVRICHWGHIIPEACRRILASSCVSLTVVTFGLHSYADTLDCIVSSFSLFLTPKPMYDTISHLACVRYNLASCLHTIRSRILLLYDINLRATHTTILSSGGVQIPIDLVSSAMDSFR